MVIWDPQSKWRCIAGRIIFKWKEKIQPAMFDYQWAFIFIMPVFVLWVLTFGCG